jgi:hypothetical protein
MLVDFAYAVLFALKHCVAKLQRAQIATQEARRDRYAVWSCPDCGQTFGRDVLYVNYAADHVVPSARGPFMVHVIITCQDCGLFNVFDATGDPLYQCGELTEERRATWIATA